MIHINYYMVPGECPVEYEIEDDLTLREVFKMSAEFLGDYPAVVLTVVDDTII